MNIDSTRDKLSPKKRTKPRIEIIIIIENNKESFIIVFLFKVNIFPVCYLNKSLLSYY